MGTSEPCHQPGDAPPWLDTTPLETLEGLPNFGWRRRMDRDFKERCRPFTLPRLHQFPGLIMLSLRYIWLWLKTYWSGKRMFIDNWNLCPWRPIYGVPIGGIGAGTIGRGYRGEFCRFQMVPGMYVYEAVQADQFIVCIRKQGKTVYQKVLSPHRARNKELSGWEWGFDASQAWYHGLYPRAWSLYLIPEHKLRLICRQISPVIPHNYNDSSLPAAVFVWNVDNYGEDELDVSIMFTFSSGQGEHHDRQAHVWTEPFSHVEGDADEVSGIIIHQQFKDMPCRYAVAARHKQDVHVSHCTNFDPRSPAYEIWQDLKEDGKLQTSWDAYKPSKVGEVGVAVCVQCKVQSGSQQSVEMSLTWDMPVIHFGARKNLYCRRYTKFFGCDGCSEKLCSYALHQYTEWEKAIDEWQGPILKCNNLPAWYKSALFNELYFISDGGTQWLHPLEKIQNDTKKLIEPVPEIVKEYGKFVYLEGHEYRMFNTYDVHHYASFALIMLWPHLQVSLQYDIAKAIPLEMAEKVKFLFSGEVGAIKAVNTVPHDVGDPDDEPWACVNAYVIHPTQEWKDLNVKFVLQVYRDFSILQDKNFLRDMYPLVKTVMESSLRWDTDGDGIIDNGGFADQTYDAWSATGASAYCGGMWLGALKVFCEMASILNHPEDLDRFSTLLEKAKESFQAKLWNGKYYNYDCSTSGHHDSIMADQLAGYWFLKSSKIPDNSVFPQENISKSLDTIFECNVMPFEDGTMGAINGMKPNGKKDFTSVQSEEFWTGVVYSLGALMFQEGKMEKGWQTAYGAYRMCYERYGLAYQTPEAYFDDQRYRSLGYMRPLSIWAMQQALEMFHPKLLKSTN